MTKCVTKFSTSLQQLVINNSSLYHVMPGLNSNAAVELQQEQKNTVIWTQLNTYFYQQEEQKWWVLKAPNKIFDSTLVSLAEPQNVLFCCTSEANCY